MDEPTTAPDGEHEVLTVLEVQHLLRISRQTVVEMIRRNEIEAFRVGKLWRVKRASIDALMRGERSSEVSSEQ